MGFMRKKILAPPFSQLPNRCSLMSSGSGLVQVKTRKLKPSFIENLQYGISCFDCKQQEPFHPDIVARFLQMIKFLSIKN